MCICDRLVPDAETAAGGNYNLRYLTAAARRSLVPMERFNALHVPFAQHPPAFAFLPEVPFTAYIPQSGFLWSDETYWNDQHGFFDNHVITENGDLLSQRVFLADKFAL